MDFIMLHMTVITNLVLACAFAYGINLRSNGVVENNLEKQIKGAQYSLAFPAVLPVTSVYMLFLTAQHKDFFLTLVIGIAFSGALALIGVFGFIKGLLLIKSLKCKQGSISECDRDPFRIE